MNAAEAATAVANWVDGTLTDLRAVYDYIPTLTSQPLPDAVVDVAHEEVAAEAPEFPMLVQQAWVHVFRMDISIMVDNTETHAASDQCREFSDLLTRSLLRDGTLGGRVDFVSPFFSFDFTPPFVERADGTRGREMTMRLVVGERVDGEDY